MQIKVDSNFKEVAKMVKGFEKQIPFAMSKAINDTLEQVKDGVEEQLEKDIDRPTPFTKRGFKVNRSNKRNQSGSVEIKPIQAKYLKYQVHGGERRASTSSPVIIPRQGQRNKYGNLPRNKLRNLKAKGKLVTKNGMALQALKKSLKPIAYFAKSASYSKRFKFYERAKKDAQRTFPKHFKLALGHAIRTAKR